MTITLDDYLMGRGRDYAAELTAEILGNATTTVGRVNLLLAMAEAAGVEPGLDQATGTAVSSGWRPAGVNSRTANAAAGSKHLTGEAVDLQDTPERALATWCLANLDALEQAGLWMERPQWTGGRDPWVHLQIVPPKSGRRCYVPSTKPAEVAMLPGEAESSWAA